MNNTYNINFTIIINLKIKNKTEEKDEHQKKTGLVNSWHEELTNFKSETDYWKENFA